MQGTSYFADSCFEEASVLIVTRLMGAAEFELWRCTTRCAP